MSDNIAGKIVVITGASSGLGEASARFLCAQGASIVLGARRVDRMQALAGELNGRGGKALALKTDVTRREQVQALVDAAVQTYGKIDVMINNAGLMPQSPLERLKVDDWDRMIDVNIKGVLYGIAAALPYMKRQKSGHIINVSSVAEHLATDELSIGDYVLSGGELGAALILDAVTRLIPGALGNEDSAVNESFSALEAAGSDERFPTSHQSPVTGHEQPVTSHLLLDCPHYTRPADFRGWNVPEVLLGGNHEEIRQWRLQKALEKTRRNRPDLLGNAGPPLEKADALG